MVVIITEPLGISTIHHTCRVISISPVPTCNFLYIYSFYLLSLYI